MPLEEPKPVNGFMSREVIFEGFKRTIMFISRYVLEIFLNALSVLKIPMSVICTLMLLNGLVSASWPAIKLSLAPGCNLPGVSRMSFCAPAVPTSSRANSHWTGYAHLLQREARIFDRLIGGSLKMGSSSLSLEVKHAELAVKDLVFLVEVSDFRAKATLVPLLNDFITDAQKTGRALQRLSSKVRGAADNIAAVNEYTLKSIEKAKAKEPSPFLQAITLWRAAESPIELTISNYLREATDVLSINLARLILEVEVNLTTLQHLEERLNSIQTLLSREYTLVTSQRRELLQRLWTRMGGNLRELRKSNHHISLLKDLGDSRSQASTQVATVSHCVRGMSEDMEIMRDGVAAPSLLGEAAPAEVHVRKIEMGLQRLKDNVKSVITSGENIGGGNESAWETLP